MGLPLNKGDEENKEIMVSGKFLRFLKRYFFKKLGIKVGRNSTFKQDDLFRAIVFLALGNVAAEQGIKMLKIYLPNELVPSADIILRRIKQLSLQQLQHVFWKALEQTVNKGKHLFFRQSVWLGIDYHDIPFFGDINAKFVVGTKRKLGTNYAFRFATIEVVEDGKRFCLGCIPVKHGDENPEVIKELILQAKKLVKIRGIFLDRGFYNTRCIGMLKRLSIKFIMPVIKDTKMKKVIKENRNEKFPIVLQYTMGEGKNNEQSFSLCLKKIVKEKEPNEIIGFATNFAVESSDVEWIAEEYRKRWGIETGYRVKKDFRAKTTSKNPVIRQLYFFLCVLLFNIWTLTNTIQKITTKLFNQIIITKYLIQTNYFSSLET